MKNKDDILQQKLAELVEYIKKTVIESATWAVEHKKPDNKDTKNIFLDDLNLRSVNLVEHIKTEKFLQPEKLTEKIIRNSANLFLNKILKENRKFEDFKTSLNDIIVLILQRAKRIQEDN